MARFQLISSELNSHVEQISHVSDRMTHSFVEAREVTGRDGDKAAIINLLTHRDDLDDNLSVVANVGKGGLGKTTLAKSVYNDKKVEEMFELKLWVCVSLDFDVTRLLREILKATGYAGEDPSNLYLDQLQTLVRTNLGGKRFLLVLDDVWNEDRVKWLDLRQFLTGGAQGSKVIVTTRSTTVSSTMTKVLHKLQGLSEEDSLSLFFRWSFGDEKLAGQNQQLEGVGKEIVKKRRGVPLALKTLGSLLYSKPLAKWISVRDSEIWEIEQENDCILAALRLSYSAMSSCLQQCFAYCSTFPEDAEMLSYDLASIWMALGILQSPNNITELEDIGELQLRELCDRSFIELGDYDSDYEGTAYTLPYECKMHDLIHDLARSITKSECCIVKSGRENISDTVRNLRLFYNQNSPTVVERLEKLRSIHVDSMEEKNISETFLSTCITKLRYLRVFDLSELSFEVLPSSIGNLKHLRYLNLIGNKRIKRIPNSICKLQSLQTLLLHHCDELEELPRDLRNLVSLRTLGVTTKQTFFPEMGIGRLKSLRILEITGCPNLRSLPHDIRYCTILRHLEVSNCAQLELASIDDTVTQLSLETFVIRMLPQTTAVPQWLKGASKSLKELQIRYCGKLGALPEWLPDFTSLETLVIKACPKISTLPDGTHRLASLTRLQIRDCNQLELASEHDEFIQMKIKKVILDGLPQTTALPTWLRGASQTLQALKIIDCQNLVSLPEWLPNIVSLQKLELVRCDELLALPKGIHCLAPLTELFISCKKLELPSEQYQGIRLNLKKFYIYRALQMTSLPQWLQQASHTLEHLRIAGCINLIALPEWLPDLTSLKTLEIDNCPKLSTLPEGMSRLTSLTHSQIEYCSSAFHERYKPEIGDDWESIAYVPNVDHIIDPRTELTVPSYSNPDQTLGV